MEEKTTIKVCGGTARYIDGKWYISADNIWFLGVTCVIEDPVEIDSNTEIIITGRLTFSENRKCMLNL